MSQKEFERENQINIVDIPLEPVSDDDFSRGMSEAPQEGEVNQQPSEELVVHHDQEAPILENGASRDSSKDIENIPLPKGPCPLSWQHEQQSDTQHGHIAANQSAQELLQVDSSYEAQQPPCPPTPVFSYPPSLPQSPPHSQSPATLSSNLLSVMHTEIQRLLKENESLQCAMVTRDQDIILLNGMIQNSEKRIQNLQNLKECDQSKIEDLQTQATEEKKGLEGKIAELEAHSKALGEKHQADVNALASRFQEETATLSSKLQKAETRVLDLQKAMESQKTDFSLKIIKVSQETVDLEAAAKKLHENLDAQNNKILELKNAQSQLSEEKSDLEAKITELVTENQKLKEEKGQIEAQRAEKEQELSELNKKLQKSEATISKVQKALDSQNEENSQENADLEAQNQKMLIDIEALKAKEASDSKEEPQNSKGATKKLAECQKLEYHVEQFQKYFDKIRNQKDNLIDEIAELKAVKDTERGDWAAKDPKIARWERKIEKRVRRLEMAADQPGTSEDAEVPTKKPRTTEDVE
uniref:BRCT domain-containing protein n=1 Tax=Caenorhabditis tropicalis TaxID=1561998 RepID=A0A1I7V3E3_9PELO